MSVDRLHLTHSKQTYRTLFKSNGFCFPRFFNLVIKVQKMFFQVNFLKLTSSATVKAIRFAGFWKPPWTKVLVRADRRTCHDGNLDFEGWKKTHPRGHLWVQKSLLCLQVCSEHLSRSCCPKKGGKVPYETKGALHGAHCVALLAKEPKIPMVYADEDMISRTKRIAEKSHPAHMSRLTVFRYTLQACMRFDGVIEWALRWRVKRGQVCSDFTSPSAF